MVNLRSALADAVEVGKEYAHAGGGNPSAIIESVYRKLVELGTEIDNSGQ